MHMLHKKKCNTNALKFCRTLNYLWFYSPRVQTIKLSQFQEEFHSATMRCLTILLPSYLKTCCLLKDFPCWRVDNPLVVVLQLKTYKLFLVHLRIFVQKWCDWIVATLISISTGLNITSFFLTRQSSVSCDLYNLHLFWQNRTSFRCQFINL